MLKDVQVPVRYYAWVAQSVAADGIDLSALFETLKLSPELLNEPEGSLPFSKVDRMVQWLQANGLRADIGFDIGRMLSATAHSFVGFGMLNSPNLDQALRFEARYFRLVMPSFQMRYRLQSAGAVLEFFPRVAMSQACLHLHLEAIGTAALREVADLNGQKLPPCRLEHSMLEPPHIQRYQRELANVEVHFGVDAVPGVRLVLLTDPRAIKLELANEHAARLAEQRCRALVQRTAETGCFAEWVAMMLREVSGELPSLGELASNLSTSKRSLNRYLAREGTSFRELAGEIQHQIACERLSSAGMSPSEVAYSLGFCDQSSFSKAFRARAGCSPGEYRRRQLSAEAD